MCVLFRIVTVNFELIVLNGKDISSTRHTVLNVDVNTEPIITRKRFQLTNPCDAEPFPITELLEDKTQ